MWAKAWLRRFGTLIGGRVGQGRVDMAARAVAAATAAGTRMSGADEPAREDLNMASAMKQDVGQAMLTLGEGVS